MFLLVKNVKWGSIIIGLLALVTIGVSSLGENDIEANLVDIDGNLPYDETYSAFNADSIFQEVTTVVRNGSKNATSDRAKVYDFWRDKRGALHLAGIIKCATNCDPLSFKGYGCYCGFLGSGEPVDGIDTCCKMHDWCYTTTTCMGIEWQLPYFVPFKWKCNGGSPYCIPGKTEKSDRNSCSHQLCECDREFAMCLQKNLPCPNSKAMCKSKNRLWQNVLMGLGTGDGVHNPYRQHSHHHKKKPHEHYFQDIHGDPHRFKPPALLDLPTPIYPFKGLRLRISGGK